jgi:hypothetical protein
MAFLIAKIHEYRPETVGNKSGTTYYFSDPLAKFLLLLKICFAFPEFQK